MKNLSEENLKNCAKKCTSVSNFIKLLGYNQSSRPKCVFIKCKELGIEIPNIKTQKQKESAINDQDLINIASNSISIAEVIRKVGFKWNGSIHTRFKRRLKKLGFTWPTASNWNKGKKLGPKKTINDYLVKNGPFIKSHDLKLKLIKSGLKQNKCEGFYEQCDLLLWHGQPLALHLDHINGDHLDNRLENLRILCPNCHSQTPTYGKPKSTLSIESKNFIGE